VSARREFDVAVLGGGPTGLVAALAASKQFRTVLIIDRIPALDDLCRIEAIPARTLALLVELGVDPRALGADRLFHGRWASWETAEPHWHPGPQTAHIERPRLEVALFQAVNATKKVTIILDRASPRCGKDFSGPGWHARNLIDATGRSSRTARSRIRPKRPWVSRFFLAPYSGGTREFCIAALRNGYAYRLASSDRIGVGFVGGSGLLKMSAAELEQMLRDENAQWLGEGLIPLAAMKQGRLGVSAVQWATAGRSMLVGEAALARDPLSSQGLAASISDAFYGVAALAAADPRAIQDRHAANLASHLVYLRESISRCRFHMCPAWSGYEQFIAANSGRLRGSRPPVLRDGRLSAGE